MRFSVAAFIAAAAGLVAAAPAEPGSCNNGQVPVGAWQQSRPSPGVCQWNQCINGGWSTRITCTPDCASTPGWCA